MHAKLLRLVAVAVGLLLAEAALAQTVTLSVSSRMAGTSTGGVLGRVELAPALDVAPPGPGPEDLPASAPTSPPIACATNSTANCVATVTTGSMVVLQAVSVTNAAFVSWSGCTSQTPVEGEPSRCNVSMTTTRTVTANFKPATFALLAKTSPAFTPTFSPPYFGWLQAPTDPIIDCQTGNPAYPACTGRVPNGAAIVVTAEPGPGSKVTSWSGCSTFTETTCTIAAMTSDRSVTASWGAGNVVVTGQVQGSGTIDAAAGGAVVDGMSCPTDCTAQVTPGGSITLTATPGSGQKLLGWTGCTVSPPDSPTCTLSGLASPVTVTATFVSASCNSCHGTPPAPPHPQYTDCGPCHPGYTSDSVVAATHMDGTVNASCTACHAFPPVAPHIQRSDCATCHPGFDPIDPTVHDNGVVNPQHAEVYGEGVCPGPETQPTCYQCHPCVTNRADCSAP